MVPYFLKFHSLHSSIGFTMFGNFFNNKIYVKITPQLLTLISSEHSRIIEDIPLVAMDKENKALAVGAAAKLMGANQMVTIVNGFDHPRTIIGNFVAGELALQHFIQLFYKGSFSLSLRPIVIMHPLGEWEGGLTQVEIRALQDLALKAGGRKVYVWTGRILSKEELRMKKLPLEKEYLLGNL